MARSADSNALSFIAVNGWRGPGAIAIAVAHFSVAADFIAYQTLLPITLLVDLFFVLSGLVIAAVYSEKLARPSAFPEYLVRRFGRIWPLQAVTLALLVAYELMKLVLQVGSGRHFSSPAFSNDGSNLITAIPTNIFLIQALGVHDRETWVFPSWSLSVEFVTYISFAAFCLVTPIMRRVLTIAAIAASLAILIFVAPYHMRSTFDYGLFRCFAGFFAGTLCYDIAARWKLHRWPMPTIVELTGVSIVLAWMSVSTGTVMVYLAPFVFCAFILAFMGEGGLVSRLLRTKPLQFLAELSFAIYMVHAVVLIFLLAALHQYERVLGRPLFAQLPNPLIGKPGAPPTVEILQTGSRAFDWAIALLYILGVSGSAYLAYRFVEIPGRAAFGRLAKRMTIKRPQHTVFTAESVAAPSERAP